MATQVSTYVHSSHDSPCFRYGRSQPRDGVTCPPEVMAKTSALVIPVVVTRLQQKSASQNHIFCCKPRLKQQFCAPMFSSIHTDNFIVLAAKILPREPTLM